jgi:hypothetical protein
MHQTDLVLALLYFSLESIVMPSEILQLLRPFLLQRKEEGLLARCMLIDGCLPSLDCFG